MDIELGEKSAEAGTVNFEELAFDWSHADSFVAAWATVQKVTVRFFDGPTVYNFAVAEDESYVADGVVVHNCRHRVSSLTKAQAEREGITESPPNVDVPDGFGKAPSSAGGGDWEPDVTDYPDDLRAVLEERLDE